MRKQRKHYRAEEKAAIPRPRLADKEPVSRLRDELAPQPTVFYRRQKEFFENAASAFQTKTRGRRPAGQERIARREKKIQTKDAVLAKRLAEPIAFKKSLGEIETEAGLSPASAIKSSIACGAGHRKLRSAPPFIPWLGVAPSKLYSRRKR